VQHADPIGAMTTITGLHSLGLRALTSELTAQIELGRTRSRWDRRAWRAGGGEVRCEGLDVGVRQGFREVSHDRIRPIAARVVLKLLPQILRRLSCETRDGGGRIALAVHAMTSLTDLRRCGGGRLASGDPTSCERDQPREDERRAGIGASRSQPRRLTGHADTRRPGFLRYLFLMASMVQYVRAPKVLVGFHDAFCGYADAPMTNTLGTSHDCK
jgi:hypothetical protein